MFWLRRLGLALLLAIVSVRPAASSGPDLADRRAKRPAGWTTTPALLSPVPSITFSPYLTPIVNRFDLATVDGYLRDLSGQRSALIGGAPYTFATRYSLAQGGEKSWQYAYERLQALGFQVRYQTYTRSGRTLKNVIATLTGQTTPSRIYVLGGHIDSTSPTPETLAPGAEDNGSGSAAVLAAAAAIAGERFDSTIELVLFSGEEQGLWGSEAYVAEAETQGRDIRSAIAMDMIAYTNNDYGLIIEGGSSWVSLMQALADAVDTFTSVNRQFSYFSWGSDHVPFQQAGIPAVLAIDLDWDEYPYYHTTGDTYARTTPALAVEIGRATLATIAQLAGPLGPTTGVSDISEVASVLRVYPNPALHPITIVSSARSIGPSRILDARGRLVRVLPSSESRRWDLRDEDGLPVARGVYWIESGGGACPVSVLR